LWYHGRHRRNHLHVSPPQILPVERNILIAVVQRTFVQVLVAVAAVVVVVVVDYFVIRRISLLFLLRLWLLLLLF
jgi:hypothetical protein